MKFFGMEEKEAIFSMDDRRTGCYPIGNNGIWHGGQHIYFSDSNTMIENPVTGTVVAGNFSKEKKWNYIILENKIKIVDKNDTEGFHCYNVIGNMRGKNDYEEYIDTEKAFTEEDLEKVKELPYYVQVYIRFPENSCTDRNNYKSFYSTVNKTKIKKTPGGTDIVEGLCQANLSKADGLYYIPAGASIYSSSNETAGSLHGDAVVSKGACSESGSRIRIKCKGKNIKLENMPAGLYVFGEEEKVNEWGNIRLQDKEKVFLWKEQETCDKYPGFGIAIDKGNARINKIFSDEKFSEEFNGECRERIVALISSIDEKNGCIYVIAEDEDKGIFPYYFTERAGESFKITDTDGEIIKPVKIKRSDYTRLTKLLTGYFKYRDDWRKTPDELWKESGLLCTKLKKEDVSGKYGALFDYVKLLKEDGEGYGSFDIKTDPGLFAGVKPYCILEAEYEVFVDKDNVYEKVRNISDKTASNMYRFPLRAELHNGVPAADAIEKAQGLLEIENITEMADILKKKAGYTWARSNGGYIYISEDVIKKLRITLRKNVPEKGDVIPAGANLGFAYNGKETEGNIISETKPYVDYALFFTEDISAKQTGLEKIEIGKGTPCVKERIVIGESDELIIIPPGAELIKKDIDGAGDYCELEKIRFSVYAYPGQVKNKKLSAEATRIWIYNFPVEIKEGAFSAVGSEKAEKSNTNNLMERIDMIKQLVDTEIMGQMREKSLRDAKDGSGNVMYEVEVEKTYNRIIKKDITKGYVCRYVQTYTKETADENVELPDEYKETTATGSLEKVLKNGTNYIKIQMEGEEYLISEDTVKENSENLLAEFMENCQTVNFGKNAISDRRICPQDRLHIEQNSENHNIDVFKKDLRERLSMIRDEEGNTLENYVLDPQKEKSNSIYENNGRYHYADLLYKYLRKTVSRHPMEWDRQLFGPAAAARGVMAFDDKSDCDIFKEFSEATGIKQNSFYFVCPTYFYSRMDELKLMFRNPYEGKTIIPRFKEGDDGDVMMCTNPGFAPAAAGANERFPYLCDGKYWAALNYAYGQTAAYKGFHYGIDLAGTEGTLVYSLVYGQIWAHCVSERYGNVLFIKGSDEKLYTLFHLNEIVKKDKEKVVPNEVVAKVGNTGSTSSGAHLHLEVFHCTETDIKKVLSKTVLKGGTTDDLYYGKFEHKTKRRNPLAYND